MSISEAAWNAQSNGAREAEKPHRTRFKTIIGTLNHNLLIDMVWKGHVGGRNHGFKARDSMIHTDLSALWTAQRTINQWWIDWCATQTSESFEEPVRFQYIDGGDSAMTRGAILLHVVNHGTYHRGYIAEMFYEVSRKPPTTDLSVFLRDVGTATKPL